MAWHAGAECLQNHNRCHIRSSMHSQWFALLFYFCTYFHSTKHVYPISLSNVFFLTCISIVQFFFKKKNPPTFLTHTWIWIIACVFICLSLSSFLFLILMLFLFLIFVLFFKIIFILNFLSFSLFDIFFPLCSCYEAHRRWMYSTCRAVRCRLRTLPPLRSRHSISPAVNYSPNR